MANCVVTMNHTSYDGEGEIISVEDKIERNTLLLDSVRALKDGNICK